MPAPDRKRRLTAFVVAIAVLIATPLAVVAADAFTDVPNTNVFHDDIAWLADAGVTKGCNPPDNTEFCPSDNVTREQMAAFMRRLAQYIDAEDGTPAHADHATTAGSANTANSASTADKVDGLDADDLVRLDYYQQEGDVLVNGADVPIGDALTISTDHACAIVMSATLDWDDNSTGTILFLNWQVNGSNVGPTYADQDEAASFSNESFAAQAVAVVGPGTHTAQLVGDAGGAGIESFATTAMCMPFAGDGAVFTAGVDILGTGTTDPDDPTQ